MATSIMIVDDHPVFSQGLKALLGQEEDLEIVGIIDEPKNTMAQIRELNPDMVITDLNMPGQTGFDIVREIKATDKKIKVLVLTMHNDSNFQDEAFKLGADGYLLKSAGFSQVIHAIRRVAEGGTFWNKRTSNSEESSIEIDMDTFILRNISSREKEILYWLTQELTASQIAEKLFLSTYTVETHKRNLLRKIKVKSTAGLVNFAIRHQIKNHDGF